MVKAVFWDKDGTIMELVHRSDGRYTAPWDLAEMKFCEGIFSSMEKTAKAGFLNIIVTNQPDLETVMDIVEFGKIKSFMMDNLPIDGFFYESHRFSERYKPNPGMVEEAVKRYRIEIDRSFLIGDSDKDLKLAMATGLAFIGIDSHVSGGSNFGLAAPLSIRQAVEIIVQEHKH